MATEDYTKCSPSELLRTHYLTAVASAYAHEHGRPTEKFTARTLLVEDEILRRIATDVPRETTGVDEP